MLAPDYESYLALIGADRLLPWPEEWEKFQTWMRERREMVESGVRRCPTWFQEELNVLDSRSRAWWDSWKEEWVIDRLQDAGIAERLTRAARHEGDRDIAESMQKSAVNLLDYGPFYLTVLHFKPTPTLQLDRELLAMLKAGDMQQYESPMEYIASKQEVAERTQEQNDAQGNEKVLAAVDKLSEKQLKQFIEVSEAIASGETIVAHGSDLKFIEHARNETIKAVAREDEDANAQRKPDRAQP